MGGGMFGEGVSVPRTQTNGSESNLRWIREHTPRSAAEMEDVMLQEAIRRSRETAEEENIRRNGDFTN